MSLFLIPLSAQLVKAENSEITVSENLGAITVQTDSMSVRIVPSQAHVMWWYGTDSGPKEMYKLQFTQIKEFVGPDSTLDDRTELFGMTYNLITEDWVYDIVEGDDKVTITLSLSGLANGADIQLIMNIYNNDELVNGTDSITDALSELKFDIVVNNWDFTATAQGYAIQTYLTEVQHRHTIRVRNGTNAEYGNATRNMMFESDAHGNDAVAFFEWATFADVYNNSDDSLLDTIDVNTVYFEDISQAPVEDIGNAEGLNHVWLVYENYGDDNKMVHDPTIGVFEDAFALGLFIYVGLPIIAGAIIITVIVLLVVKRKK